MTFDVPFHLFDQVTQEGDEVKRPGPYGQGAAELQAHRVGEFGYHDVHLPDRSQDGLGIPAHAVGILGGSLKHLCPG